MTLVLDHSKDWQVWDHLEYVEYTCTREDGTTRTDRVKALRSQQINNEFISGTMIGNSRSNTWTIPQDEVRDLLADGTELHPGDKLKSERDGRQYTVINATWYAFQGVWRIETVI